MSPLPDTGIGKVGANENPNHEDTGCLQRDRGFESLFLHRGVWCEPHFRGCSRRCRDRCAELRATISLARLAATRAADRSSPAFPRQLERASKLQRLIGGTRSTVSGGDFEQLNEISPYSNPRAR